jgi:3',5'-cyclic AMP phosphodiesterase CpdA
VTGQLISSIGGTVFTAGDNAYPNATASDFQKYYDPFWGAASIKPRTRPVPGNHEYDPPGDPNNYYDYFGAAAGPRGLGYYSYEVGDWHVIALNSARDFSNGGAQLEWMKSDLAAHQNTSCTAVIWHHPLFSSGRNGNSGYTRDAWTWLYQAGVEMVINGHDHSYERFAPQTPDGVADPNGIREFVVGTGGAVPYEFPRVLPNSETRLTGAPNNNLFGVLKLTLITGSYEWDFVTSGGTQDHGTGQCHGPNNRAATANPFAVLQRR